MKKMPFLFLFLLFAGLDSNGLDSMNQTLSPSPGTSEVRARLSYEENSATITNGSGSIRGAGFQNQVFGPETTDSNLSYYYGESESAAIGVELGFADFTSQTSFAGAQSQTTDTAGLGGLIFGYKGSAPLRELTLFSMANFETPIGRNSSTTNGGSVHSDAWPAQNKLSAALGPLLSFDGVTYGALARYSHLFAGHANRQVNGVSQNADIQGGDAFALAAMTEWENIYHPNVQLTYGKVFGHREQSGGVTTHYDGDDYFSVIISSRYPFQPNFEGIGNIGFSALQPNSYISIGRYTFISLGGRFLF